MLSTSTTHPTLSHAWEKDILIWRGLLLIVFTTTWWKSFQCDSFLLSLIRASVIPLHAVMMTKRHSCACWHVKCCLSRSRMVFGYLFPFLKRGNMYGQTTMMENGNGLWNGRNLSRHANPMITRMLPKCTITSTSCGKCRYIEEKEKAIINVTLSFTVWNKEKRGNKTELYIYVQCKWHIA